MIFVFGQKKESLKTKVLLGTAGLSFHIALFACWMLMARNVVGVDFR